jgi:hypothetical protein
MIEMIVIFGVVCLCTTVICVLAVLQAPVRQRYDWRDYAPPPTWTSSITTYVPESKDETRKPKPMVQAEPSFYVPPVEKKESSYTPSSPTPPTQPSTYDMGFW